MSIPYQSIVESCSTSRAMSVGSHCHLISSLRSSCRDPNSQSKPSIGKSLASHRSMSELSHISLRSVTTTPRSCHRLSARALVQLRLMQSLHLDAPGDQLIPRYGSPP